MRFIWLWFIVGMVVWVSFGVACFKFGESRAATAMLRNLPLEEGDILSFDLVAGECQLSTVRRGGGKYER